MNTPAQPPLPLEPGAIDWPQGVECCFHQLPDVIRRADAAGFDAVRLRVLPAGYAVGFQRRPEKSPSREAGAGKGSGF